MIIRLHTISQSLISILVFFVSLFFLEMYEGGDFERYRSYYDAISRASLIDAFSSYRNILGASEPLYFFVSWILSFLGISYIFFVSLSNSILCFVFLNWCFLRFRASLFPAICVLSNFYFFVLFFELERLKLAFIFYFISLSFFGGYKRTFSAFLSISSHFQLMVLLAANYIDFAFKKLTRTILYGKLDFILLVVFVFLSFLAYKFSEYFFEKISFYYEGLDYLALVKFIPFLILFIYLGLKLNRFFQMICVGTLFSLLTLFLGGDRLNILAFFFVLPFLLKVKKGINFAGFFLLVYFGGKGVLFLYNIILYGRGYQ